jgi:mannosyl-oligosaccharide alpha-1,2-mannosidase
MRSSFIAALGLASAVSAAPRRHGRATGGPDAEKAAAIKEVYKESWGAYYRYAFPNDTLNPVSQTYQNDR